MAESTLKYTWTDLETEIGRYLGNDRDKTNWSTDQDDDVQACIKRGLHQFYFPPRISDEPVHSWSFLRPRATLTIWDDVVAADAITQSASSLASGETTITASASVFYPSMEYKTLIYDESSNEFTIKEYVSATQVILTGDATGEDGNTITIDSDDHFTLPWDYGGMAGDGKFTFDNAENTLSHITVTSDVAIRKLRESSIDTGTPYLAAILPRTADGTEGQRWEVLFHQPPDEVFILHYRYYVLPDAIIETSAEYPYGSAAHSETILASCLAIAEVREQDPQDTTHRENFARLLQSSIDRDKRLGDPIQKYGYMGDTSDGREEVYAGHRHCHRHFDLVTFNGI